MIEVVPAAGPYRRAALEILFDHLSPAERDRQVEELLVEESPVDLSELLIATRDGRPVGAALSLLQPDGCGYVWPPRSNDAARHESIVDGLFAEMLARHAAAEVWVSQCLIDQGDIDERRDLVRNRFTHLSDLRYLHRDLRQKMPDVDCGLEAIAVSPEDEPERFARIIEASYEQTRDCPGLNGLRTGLEAVTGHKTTGGYLPDEWYLFREEGTDVGVLILADQPEQDAWEVVYMGVPPHARGRGYGRAIVSQAIRAARRSGRRSLLLAVDGDNQPALRIYESLGFGLLAEKSVYIHPGRRRV